MASTTQYLPTAVKVTLNGKQVTDFAKGTFIKVTPVQSRGGVSYGADGGATVYGSAVAGVKVEFTMRQNSAGNAMIHAMFQTQNNNAVTGTPLKLVDVSISDASSGSVLVRNPGIFTDMAEKDLSEEPGTRAYSIEVPSGMSNAVESYK